MRRTQRLQIAHGFSNAHVPQKQKRPLPDVPLTVAAQNQLALLLYAISLHAPVRTQQQGHDAGPSKPAANRRMQLTVSASMPWSKLKVRGGFLTVQPNHGIHRHQETNPFPRSWCPLCSLLVKKTSTRTSNASHPEGHVVCGPNDLNSRLVLDVSQVGTQSKSKSRMGFSAGPSLAFFIASSNFFARMSSLFVS